MTAWKGSDYYHMIISTTKRFRLGCHTVSFSTIAEAPRTAADSNVNIELSRCELSSVRLLHIPNKIETHIECGEILSIRIERVVIELRKLLYVLSQLLAGRKARRRIVSSCVICTVLPTTPLE